jgi:phosphate/sulfate permease
MSTRAKVAWWIVAALVAAFLIATLATAIHTPSSASVVNQGCAAHQGVASWGGNGAYSARCKDGYAFEGSRYYWTPPFWWPQ